MDHITQLKKIRDEALERLQDHPDFKLAHKLGELIEDLGETLDDDAIFDIGPAADADDEDNPVVETTEVEQPVEEEDILSTVVSFEPARTETVPEVTHDEAIDELVAELEGDTEAILRSAENSQTADAEPLEKPQIGIAKV